MNPLGKGQQNMNTNPINEMLDFLNNGGSREQIFEQMIKNNPQFNALTHLQNPKQMVMDIAKKNNIDIKQIEELAHKLGAK